MKKSNYKPQIPDLMEAVFDAVYLTFDLAAAVLFFLFSKGNILYVLLGIGLQVSSITMTMFYILLMYIWKYTFPELKIPVVIEVVIWISAVIRIVICMFPQNNWCTDEGNMKLSVIRNAVFAVTGIGVMILYLISGNTYGYHMTRMAAAIIISFGCYLPVTLFSKTKPQVGLLMIPKTCAYMWIIVMGLQLMF